MRQRDRETERQRDRETERQRDRETERQKDRKTERQTIMKRPDLETRPSSFSRVFRISDSTFSAASRVSSRDSLAPRFSDSSSEIESTKFPLPKLIEPISEEILKLSVKQIIVLKT
jgi:hypothetical protein